MWTKALIVLPLIQLCFHVEAILKRVVKGWIHEEFFLTDRISTEDDLLLWFRQHKVLGDTRHLDLSEATLAELSRLPLVFYKEYAYREHFEQIWPILRDENHLSAHLKRIKEMAAFVEPGVIPNTITKPDGSIPWRRQTDDSYYEDSSSSSQSNTGEDTPPGGTTNQDPSSSDQDSTLVFKLSS